MRTRVKDFIDISDYTSLERLITTLVAIRDSLPETADPELKMRGDDVFGRRFSISYFRDLTPKEAELEARYSSADAVGRELAELTGQLDIVDFKGEGHKRKAA